MAKSEDRSSEKAELLLDLSLSAESNWEILITTGDKYFLSTIKNLLSGDEQIKIENVKFGCDALIACAKKIPDLLIIDEELPDIPSEMVITCLKRSDELKKIKILYCLKSSKTNAISDLGADDYINKVDIEKSCFLKKVNSLLYTSSLHSYHPPTEHGLYHERKWPRTTLSISAKVEMVMVSDPNQVDHGEAILENISRGGAFLSRIKLPKGLIPYETYYVRLKVDQPPLKDWKADSIIVRFNPRGPTGVEFLNISPKDQMQIAKLFKR